MSKIIHIGRGKTLGRDFDISDLTEGAYDVMRASCVTPQPHPGDQGDRSRDFGTPARDNRRNEWVPLIPSASLVHQTASRPGPGGFEYDCPDTIESQPAKDWSNQELATLYRTKKLLAEVATFADTDRGISDEGSPWFAFCDSAGEVLVHIARIDGVYIIDGVGLPEPLKGPSFEALIENLFRSASGKRTGPVTSSDNILKLPQRRSGKVFVHPAAQFAALVWAAATLDQNDSTFNPLYADDTDSDHAGFFQHRSSVRQVGDDTSVSDHNSIPGSSDQALKTKSVEKINLLVPSEEIQNSDEQSKSDAFNHKVTSFLNALGAIAVALDAQYFQHGDAVAAVHSSESSDDNDQNASTAQPNESAVSSAPKTGLDLFSHQPSAAIEAANGPLHADQSDQKESLSAGKPGTMGELTFEIHPIAEIRPDPLQAGLLPGFLTFHERAEHGSGAQTPDSVVSGMTIALPNETPLSKDMATETVTETPVHEQELSIAVAIANTFGLMISNGIDLRSYSFVFSDDGATQMSESDVSSGDAPNNDAAHVIEINRTDLMPSGSGSPTDEAFAVRSEFIVQDMADKRMWEIIGDFLAGQETVTALEGDNLLIIDSSVTDYGESDVQVITWTFHDGSAISIVGVRSDLQDLVLHA